MPAALIQPKAGPDPAQKHGVKGVAEGDMFLLPESPRIQDLLRGAERWSCLPIPYQAGFHRDWLKMIDLPEELMGVLAGWHTAPASRWRDRLQKVWRAVRPYR